MAANGRKPAAAAAPAGKVGDSPDPLLRAPRPYGVQPALDDRTLEVLAARAQDFHRAYIASGRCHCVGAGHYPCPQCRRELLEMISLLDRVVRDTIDTVMRTVDRMLR